MDQQSLGIEEKFADDNWTGWRPEGCDRIALIFQGGGALGAYQAGVYQALHEADIEPDWVTGVSIGAINAAIIAGNERKNRIPRLREFWERITDRRIWAYTPDGDIYRRARNATSAWMTMALGQPGFFKPHPVNAWGSPAGAATATSFYDPTPLRQTLLDLIDFPMINNQACRFAVGAVNVQSGNFIYFDNVVETIIPKSWRAALSRQRCRWSKLGLTFIGTGASFPTHRSNTCLITMTAKTRWYSKWIYLALEVNFHATWRMCSAGTRTSCIPQGRDTIRMSTVAY